MLDGSPANVQERYVGHLNQSVEIWLDGIFDEFYDVSVSNETVCAASVSQDDVRSRSRIHPVAMRKYRGILLQEM